MNCKLSRILSSIGSRILADKNLDNHSVFVEHLPLAFVLKLCVFFFAQSKPAIRRSWLAGPARQDRYDKSSWSGFLRLNLKTFADLIWPLMIIDLRVQPFRISGLSYTYTPRQANPHVKLSSNSLAAAGFELVQLAQEEQRSLCKRSLDDYDEV